MNRNPPVDVEPHPDCDDCGGTGSFETGVVSCTGQPEVFPCMCYWRYQRTFDLLPDSDLIEIRARLTALPREEWEIYNGPGAPTPFEPYTNAAGRGATKPGVWVRAKEKGGQGWAIGVGYAPFVSNSRQDVPKLLDEVEFQRYNARQALKALEAGDKREAVRMLRGLVPEKSESQGPAEEDKIEEILEGIEDDLDF